MKVLFIAFISICSFTITKAQSTTPTFEMKVEVVNANGGDNGKIIVKLDGAESECVYRLLDNYPWEGGVELYSTSFTLEKEYLFENLKPAKYLVCVTDKSKNSKCEFRTIGEE